MAPQAVPGMAPAEGDQVPSDPSQSLMPSEPGQAPVSADTPAISPEAAASLTSMASAPSGLSGTPSMIGDFFGGGYQLSLFGQPNVATAGGDRRVKYSENNSPFPQDRVFFNYHHFHNAVQDVRATDQDVNRFTFGIERTFGDGFYSWELRIPFAGGLDATQDTADPDPTAVEFGNISLALKRLLYRNRCFAVATGLGIIFPTGDDFEVIDGSFNSVAFRFDNDAVHLQPFLGVFYQRHPRLFHQFFVQADFDANGNDVVGIGGETGVLQDPALLFLDYSAGYWLYRNPCSGRYITGLAPMIELHYSTTMQDQDFGPAQLQGQFIQDFRRDVLHLTAGLFFQLGNRSSLRVAGIAPLRDGSDRFFDSEFGVQFVRGF